MPVHFAYPVYGAVLDFHTSQSTLLEAADAEGAAIRDPVASASPRVAVSVFFKVLPLFPWSDVDQALNETLTFSTPTLGLSEHFTVEVSVFFRHGP